MIYARLVGDDVVELFDDQSIPLSDSFRAVLIPDPGGEAVVHGRWDGGAFLPAAAAIPFSGVTLHEKLDGVLAFVEDRRVKGDSMPASVVALLDRIKGG